MANFLSITKEDNEQFSFILNGDTVNEIINTRNDLLTFGNECHFKTANGANLVKEQKIIFSNVSLFNGPAPVAAPVSVRDLFDKLTALEFFEWIRGVSGGGVNRFTELLDTFEFLGKSGQFVVVSDDELQLVTKTITLVEKSTDLSDMPNPTVPGKMLSRSDDNTQWLQVDIPAGSNGLKQQFSYITGPQVFTLGSQSILSAVFWNGALLDDSDWSQDPDNMNQLTILFPLSSGDKIKPIGII